MSFQIEDGILVKYDGEDEIISIPENVTQIAESAFYSCNSIRSIRIPRQVKIIASYAFWNCNNISSVYVEDLSSWMTIEMEGYHSNPLSNGADLYENGTVVSHLHITSEREMQWRPFQGCTSVISIEFKEGIKSIPESAFSGCRQLKAVYVPQSLKRIGNYAFEECDSFQELHVPNLLSWISVSKGEEWGNPIQNGGLLYVGDEQIKEFYIPDGVSIIGRNTFEKCSTLTDIEIPSSVTKIEESAFAYCDNLTSITIPDSVSSIGKNAFFRCSLLQKVSLPKSIDRICEGTFSGCENLRIINIPESVQSIGKEAFYQCKNLKDIHFPMSIVKMGENAFAECNCLESISFPESLEEIKQGAFRECKRLQTVCFSGTSLKIDDRVFLGCTSLERIELWAKRIRIGKKPFKDCHKLYILALPESIIGFDKQTFENQDALVIINLEYHKVPHPIKNKALKGMANVFDTIELSEPIRKSYVHAFKMQNKKIASTSIQENYWLILFMLEHGFIDIETIGLLILKASQEGDVELQNKLMAYQNEKFLPSDYDKQWKKKIGSLRL